jgi:hypothetical protein
MTHATREPVLQGTRTHATRRQATLMTMTTTPTQAIHTIAREHLATSFFFLFVLFPDYYSPEGNPHNTE